MIFDLTIWQLLLLLVALEMILAPFIVGVFTGIFNGYFKAKDAHVARISKAAAMAFESCADTIIKRVEKK